ncbi:MAG: N-6 DNA methylase [bacterium]|nr:N-6 DNA methylase [bacterium]
MKHKSERRTEQLIQDLLNIQGWPVGRPPKGRVVQQNEYKAFVQLEAIFKGRSKRGSGDAYPDFLTVAENSYRPQMVIEAKANERDIEAAFSEVCNIYGEACIKAGHPVIAVGIAGQEKTEIQIRVAKFLNDTWQPIVYAGKPISWLPTPADVDRLLINVDLFDLAPVVPRVEVLAEKADFINRLLREASVKDEYRPAYIGAMMLGLWQSKGQIRKASDYVLNDINKAAEDAFIRAGKSELARSLRLDEANVKLANSAWQILATLEKLNVVSAAFDHDYLGQLYEIFFRYTGGNTIGQYFTPRHVARFMADICQTSLQDVVIDPACGTGGFLVACIQRAYENLNASYEDAVEMVRNQLLGYESEPVTAALCVANMILRGDGKTGIRKADCFSASDYPMGQCQVALMNPPFPHKKTDTPTETFIARALDALETRGKLAVIVPTSLLVKKDKGIWRKAILQKHTLLGVCQMPDEIFQPFASATTSVLLIEKGIPHNAKQKTVFVRTQEDGFSLKKGIRIPRQDNKNDLPQAVDAILNKTITPGFSGVAAVKDGDEWSPGAYIPSGVPTEADLKISVDELLRRLASFYIRYAQEVANQRKKIQTEELTVKPYRSILSKARLDNAQRVARNSNTIGDVFDIYYGQKELHSREGIPPGSSLVISPTEQYNGCYGWLSVEPLLKPPFITVAQTGTIGEAFVQLEPCAVNDDCLVLLPKQVEPPLSLLFIAAATIRLEKWRFSYGRKLTPRRICDFPLSITEEMKTWAEDRIKMWLTITENAVEHYL